MRKKRNLTCKSFSSFSADTFLENILEEDVEAADESRYSLQNVTHYVDERFNEAVLNQFNKDATMRFSNCLLHPNQVSMVDERFTRKEIFSLVHSGKLKGLDKLNPSKLTQVSLKVMTPSTDINIVRTYLSE